MKHNAKQGQKMRSIDEISRDETAWNTIGGAALVLFAIFMVLGGVSALHPHSQTQNQWIIMVLGVAVGMAASVLFVFCLLSFPLFDSSAAPDTTI